MTPNRFSLATLLLLLAALPAWSKSALRVEALQGPNWVERGNIRAPAQAGQALEPGDTLRSGREARSIVKFPDGSRFQLGENTVARLEAHRAADGRTLFAIPHGAYRLSTTPAVAGKQRDIQLKTGALALDIRHADMWGATQENGDTVCLREGRIVVMRDHKLFSLEEDPACLDAALTQQETDKWLRQTGLLAGHGIIRVDGAWKVNVLSLAKHADLARLLAQLRAAGYPAEIVKVQVKHRNFFRLRIAGLASKRDAQYLAERLKKDKKIEGLWVSPD